MPFHQPVFSYVILGINVVVFFADMLLGGWLTYWGAKSNTHILAGEYWRLLTPMFLHVGIIHLGFNSYFLFRIGPQIERTYGHLRFMVIYLLSGIAGAVASFAFNIHPSIGASGALFGLLGAMLPLFYRNRNLLNAKSQMRSIIMTIVVNLLYGLQPGIDNWGHVGGLLSGLVLGWFSSPRYVLRDRMGDLLRIDNETSPISAWAAFAVAGAMLGIITVLLIALRMQ